MGPKMSANILFFENSQLHRASVAQALLAGIILYYSVASKWYCLQMRITHKNSLRKNFPITYTSFTKELSPNYLCNHFGPHRNKEFNWNNPPPPPPPPQKNLTKVKVSSQTTTTQAICVAFVSSAMPPAGLAADISNDR